MQILQPHTWEHRPSYLPLPKILQFTRKYERQTKEKSHTSRPKNNLNLPKPQSETSKDRGSQPERVPDQNWNNRNPVRKCK